jgi:NitT/TauT family transport system substrate-binding protein
VRFAQASALNKGYLPGSVRRKHVVALAVAALTAAPLAAGCSGSGSGNNTSGTTTIRVAAVDGVDTAPLFIANKDGAFARAGLNIKIQKYATVADELGALSNGDVDIAVGDYVDFFSKVAKSPKAYLSVVADAYNAGPGVMEVLTLPGSGISTPQQLVHHTIGTTEPQGGYPVSGSKPYNLDMLATESVLQSDGVSASNITWKPYATGAELISALKNHQVGAILVEEPYIYEAESTLGAVPVLDSCSGATANLPLSGYFATSAFAHDRSSAVHTFVKVLDRAQVAAAEPGPVRAQLSSEPGMGMKTASLVTLGTYPSTLNAASVQRVSSLMFDFEMLTHAIGVGRLIQ